MKSPRLWYRALRTIVKAREEVVKVSQMGRTQINRSFLLHERNKLFRKLGEKAYGLLIENKIKSSDLDRIVDQISRVGKKITEVENRMKELTKDFSLKLDAEENTDKLKKSRKKKNKSKFL